jgi:hypothetical protein
VCLIWNFLCLDGTHNLCLIKCQQTKTITIGDVVIKFKPYALSKRARLLIRANKFSLTKILKRAKLFYQCKVPLVYKSWFSTTPYKNYSKVWRNFVYASSTVTRHYCAYPNRDPVPLNCFVLSIISYNNNYICESDHASSGYQLRNIRNWWFCFKAKFREKASLFREKTKLVSFLISRNTKRIEFCWKP